MVVSLLTRLFSEKELSSGNCTKPRKERIVLLDQSKVLAIRGE